MIAPEWGTVLHVTGSGPVLEGIRHLLAKEVPSDFDGLCAIIGDILAEIHAELLARFYPLDSAFIVFLGGWSAARSRWEAFECSSLPLDEHIEPWSLQQIISYAKPNPEEQHLSGVGLIPSCANQNPSDLSA
jgi:hypothetical protein